MAEQSAPSNGDGENHASRTSIIVSHPSAEARPRPSVAERGAQLGGTTDSSTLREIFSVQSPSHPNASSFGERPWSPSGARTMTIPAHYRGRDRTLPSLCWAVCVVTSAVLSSVCLTKEMNWVSRTYIMDIANPLLAQYNIDWPRPKDGSTVDRS